MSQCCERWASTITRVVDDMWEWGLDNLEALSTRDRTEIVESDRRFALPVGEGKGRKRGYAIKGERFGKQRRRQKLASRLVDTERRLTEDRVSIVAGGKKLLRKRHHLEEASKQISPTGRRPPPGGLRSHRQKKPGIRCEAKRQLAPLPPRGSVW